MFVHPMTPNIADYLARYERRPPAGLDAAQFREYIEARRSDTVVLVESLVPFAEGLLLPVRIAGGAWGVSREMRRDGSAWRVTRFDADMVPMGHHAHDRVEAAVEDVLRWADRTRLREAQFGLYDVTKTLAFRTWFDGSKVIDAEGRPLVVYHGTASNFSAFGDGPWFYGSTIVNARGLPPVVYHGTAEDVRHFVGGKVASNTNAAWSHMGHFFTPDPELASDFTKGKNWTKKRASPKHGGNVMPVYLAIRNPLIVPASRVLPMSGSEAKVRALRAEAEDAGHDGIVIEPFRKSFGFDDTTNELAMSQYVAFRPEQIKSAIGNRGTFDPTSKNILFSQPASKVPRSHGRATSDVKVHEQSGEPSMTTANHECMKSEAMSVCRQFVEMLRDRRYDGYFETIDAAECMLAAIPGSHVAQFDSGGGLKILAALFPAASGAMLFATADEQSIRVHDAGKIGADLAECYDAWQDLCGEDADVLLASGEYTFDPENAVSEDMAVRGYEPSRARGPRC